MHFLKKIYFSNILSVHKQSVWKNSLTPCTKENKIKTTRTPKNHRKTNQQTKPKKKSHFPGWILAASMDECVLVSMSVVPSLYASWETRHSKCHSFSTAILCFLWKAIQRHHDVMFRTVSFHYALGYAV